MQKLLLPMIGLLSAVLASGCNNAKSSAAVAKDVAIAQQQASSEIMDAKKDAAKEVDGAATKLNHTSKDVDDAGAKASYEVALAQADGDHKVAIQKCSALSGMALKSCTDQADTSFEQAKTHANVIRLNN